MADYVLSRKVDPQRDALKVPPHSSEAEQSVLGGLMLDNQAWDKVAERLREKDFYRFEHRLLFRTIATLANRGNPFDVLTLTEALKNTNELADAGGEMYLFELARNTPTAANIAAYADIVRERSVLRQLISIATEITENAFLPGERSSTDLLDEAERKVFQIAEQGLRGSSGPVHISDLLAKTVDRIDTIFNSGGGITGLATGYTDLDKMTSGLQAADLIIVAARPSMGKTTFAMNVAEHVALKNNKPVLVFSMEMPGDSLTMRMVSSLGRIDQQNLRNGNLKDDDWSRITSTINMLHETPIFIDDTASLSPGEMRARARRVAREHGQLGLIVIDYLQLMSIPGHKENRTNEISEISRSLKSLAKELNVPVIALSQLNRGLEQRTDKRPVMSDLRECVTGDTLVCLSDGRRVPIQELVGKTPEVLAVTEAGKLVAAQSEIVWKVGSKPIFNLRLASGRVIRATDKHRLFAADGWRTIADLKVDDRLAIARHIPAPAQPILWSEKRLALLGQLIGDGSYLKGQPLRYTNQTEENLRIVIDSAEEEFGVKTTIYSSEHAWKQIVFSGNGNRWSPAGINKWLRDLEIFNQRSHEKRVPKEIFQLNNQQIAIFLRHLWATDGTIYTRKTGVRGSHVIQYATNSQGLAYDVAALLLRFGVVARIKKTQKQSYRPGYLIVISGIEYQKTFLDQVGAFGRRLPQALQLAEALKNIKGNTNVDTLPKQFFDRVRILLKLNHITHRSMAAMRGTSYGGNAHYSFSPSRAVLGEYAAFLNDDILRAQTENDLFWDRIVSIEPDGVEEVYDLTVPEHHSWLADGIVSHNSGAIEQDADIILFIYRDEVYNENSPNKGSAEIIIAKQRNGPIGKIFLTFLGKHTRFENSTMNRYDEGANG